MDRRRLDIAKSDIVRHFESLPLKVLRRSDFDQALREQRGFWRADDATGAGDLIRFLVEETELEEVRLKFTSRAVVRYIWPTASVYELALSIRHSAYLSHYTAMHLHGLTEQVPKTIYVNDEQSPKPESQTDLSQDRINSAFRRPARRSKNVASHGDHSICILNGKNTGRLGVVDVEVAGAGLVAVTDVERTLIDSAVRPAYAGGVFEILSAYRKAAKHISVNRLAAMLKKLAYKYPYHQVIGFYLERCGAYRDSQIRLMRKARFDFDFYLANQMGETDYSEKWRLFVPKGM